MAHKNFREVVISLVLFSFLSVFSTFSAELYVSYNDDRSAASEYTNNMATLFHDIITRNIEAYDFSLKALADKMVDPSFIRLMVDDANTHVLDGFAGVFKHGFLYVLNQDGIAIAASRPVPPALNLATREYFKAHLNPDNSLQLFISRPFQNRMDDGKWTIAFSRRVSRADGSLLGVIVGAVELDFFVDLFRAVHLPPQSSITLFYRDGTMVVRASDGGTAVMVDADTDPVFRHLLNAPPGDFLARSSIDNIERLNAHRSIAATPLYLTVGLSVDEIFQRWRQKALIMIMGFVLLIGLIVLLVLVLRRELDRRYRAEKELATLASTDGLTKLCNRRSFDESFDGEWKRAARACQPLSLLMIDVDFFKSYNDTYGHLAGDKALVAVADALRANKKRPADIIARYGGEEFVVMLPETSVEGALTVAETIRSAVVSQQIAHAGSPLKLLTISVGVASLTPTSSKSSSGLLQLADEALYRAKTVGRNQVSANATVLAWRSAASAVR